VRHAVRLDSGVRDQVIMPQGAGSPCFGCPPLGQQVAWRYETEHPKRKHGWDRTEAGFEVIQDVPVGKCPNGFSGALAESLLNSGVPFHNSRSGRDWPDRIYVVHEGVLY